MCFKKLLVAAVVFAVLAQAVHTVSSIATMSYYVDPVFFGVWSKVMMPGQGAPPAEFYYFSIAFAFVTGLLYAVGFESVKKALPGKGVKKGLTFALLLYGLAGVPMTLTLYLVVNLPLGLLAVWNFVDGLLLFALAGVAFVRVLGE